MKNRSKKGWFTGFAIIALIGLSTIATADSRRAFVPMGATDSVGIIDLNSHQALPPITGTVNTHGSALTPDGHYLVAGSLTDHDSEDPVSRPEGVTEEDHAAHHGGGAAAASEGATTGRIYVVDTAKGEIARTVKVPGPVHHVVVTPDGRFAVSTHPMGGGISVVDLESGELVKTVATGPAPNYVVATDNGQSILVSNTDNGTVSEVDNRHWFVKRNHRVGGGPEHMVLSPDNETLYVNDGKSGDVVVLGLSRGEVLERYEVGPQPHGVGLSADGQILYATSKGGNQVVRIELASGTRDSMPLAPAPYHLAISPVDGSLLITSRAEAKLWVLDPGSLEIIDDVSLDGIGHQISLEAY
jgi:DNA-binding beta-propeller fold protein YncE